MTKDYSFLTNLINEDVYYIQSATDQPSQEKGASDVTNSEEINTKDEVKDIDYAGQNLKKILVLVEEQDQQFLNPADEAFLKKVLQAVDVDLNDIALVNTAGINQEQINNVQIFPHELRLCFTEKMPDALPEPGLNLYQITQHEGKKILWCDPLGSISQNKEMKVKLWQQLKLLFNK